MEIYILTGVLAAGFVMTFGIVFVNIFIKELSITDEKEYFFVG